MAHDDVGAVHLELAVDLVPDPQHDVHHGRGQGDAQGDGEGDHQHLALLADDRPPYHSPEHGSLLLLLLEAFFMALQFLDVDIDLRVPDLVGERDGIAPPPEPDGVLVHDDVAAAADHVLVPALVVAGDAADLTGIQLVF